MTVWVISTVSIIIATWLAYVVGRSEGKAIGRQASDAQWKAEFIAAGFVPAGTCETRRPADCALKSRTPEQIYKDIQDAVQWDDDTYGRHG